jgi:hypothetical protein
MARVYAYEFHAKVDLPYETKVWENGIGRFPSTMSPMGPLLIQLDRGRIVHPAYEPTIEMRMSPALRKALDHEWLVVEVNQLRPIAAIPKVYERPVPLPLDEIDNEYDIEVRLDIGEARGWSPELSGEIEVVLRGTR